MSKKTGATDPSKPSYAATPSITPPVTYSSSGTNGLTITGPATSGVETKIPEGDRTNLYGDAVTKTVVSNTISLFNEFKKSNPTLPDIQTYLRSSVNRELMAEMILSDVSQKHATILLNDIQKILETTFLRQEEQSGEASSSRGKPKEDTPSSTKDKATGGQKDTQGLSLLFTNKPGQNKPETAKEPVKYSEGGRPSGLTITIPTSTGVEHKGLSTEGKTSGLITTIPTSTGVEHKGLPSNQGRGALPEKTTDIFWSSLGSDIQDVLEFFPVSERDLTKPANCRAVAEALKSQDKLYGHSVDTVADVIHKQSTALTTTHSATTTTTTSSASGSIGEHAKDTIITIALSTFDILKKHTADLTTLKDYLNDPNNLKRISMLVSTEISDPQTSLEDIQAILKLVDSNKDKGDDHSVSLELSPPPDSPIIPSPPPSPVPGPDTTETTAAPTATNSVSDSADTEEYDQNNILTTALSIFDSLKKGAPHLAGMGSYLKDNSNLELMSEIVLQQININDQTILLKTIQDILRKVSSEPDTTSVDAIPIPPLMPPTSASATTSVPVPSTSAPESTETNTPPISAPVTTSELVSSAPSIPAYSIETQLTGHTPQDTLYNDFFYSG